MRRWTGLVTMVLVAACATSAPSVRPSTEAPSWPSLSRFSSEAEFLAYLDAATVALRATIDRYRSGGKQEEPEPCPPDDPDCLANGEEAVVVTGSRLVRQDFEAISPVTTASGETITNVQTAGVDEGDIVKMIGRFLIVLQDGRLFSIDTGASSQDLALIDRVNVYRRHDANVWYDEILVFENRIVVTGFSYGENATEFTVFSMAENGRFTREGVYYLSSDDYYDTENYATRLVNGNLVIYTPLDVSGFGSGDQPNWPLVRRWLRDGAHGAVATPGRTLFDARDIYRPIQATNSPSVHTISVCPLGSPSADDELDCRSTAIAGTAVREF